MSDTITSRLDPEARQLLLDAAMWRLLELLLSRPTAEWTSQLAALSAEIDDPDLLQAATLAAREATPALYDTTFGPGGPAAPREISYRQCLDAGAFLSEINSFYRAFDYSPTPGEPPDHVAVQAGFIGYLLLKQLYALRCGDEDKANLTAEAIDRFSHEHLGTLAEPLAASLDLSGIDYLALTGRTLLHRVGPMRRLDALPHTRTLEILPDPDVDGAESCSFDD